MQIHICKRTDARIMRVNSLDDVMHYYDTWDPPVARKIPRWLGLPKTILYSPALHFEASVLFG